MLTAREQLQVFLDTQTKAREFHKEALEFIRSAPIEEAVKMLGYYGIMQDGDEGYGWWQRPNEERGWI